MLRDNDGNMILTDGLVLQEERYWKEFLKREIIPQSNSCELYFEEADIEEFAHKLENLYPDIQYVNGRAVITADFEDGVVDTSWTIFKMNYMTFLPDNSNSSSQS